MERFLSFMTAAAPLILIGVAMAIFMTARAGKPVQGDYANEGLCLGAVLGAGAGLLINASDMGILTYGLGIGTLVGVILGMLIRRKGKK